MKIFGNNLLKKLYKPKNDSQGEDNGQVTIIGGSDLFHGAPILSLKVASRTTDMVFFSSPEPREGDLANKIKSKLMSFIWVPFEEVERYIEKSDAVLIGPGMKRYSSESKIPNDKFQITNNKSGKVTRDVTERLLIKFPNKKWVIDAGSLQTMDPDWIPEGAILTPNKREFEILFKTESQVSSVEQMAKKYKCIIVSKGPTTYVSSTNETLEIKGGNPGLTKGGAGDVLAGLTVGLLAKNEPFLAACSASFLAKYAADELYKKYGTFYNADDLANYIPLLFPH